ncbi:MAG: hypothetical protein ACJA0Z_002085 [Halioglobus sp.]|jgi:hypothetical protein
MLFVFSPKLLALEFQCEITGDTRYLRLEIPGKERLCEVTANYKSTGERRVMWYADKDTLFCSAKIYALKDKYEKEWKFKCEQWPDLDGIDQLSPSNRQILDTQLKLLITKGNNSNPRFSVNRVKAVASNLFDKQPGALALQFFLSSGDVTQVITGDGKSWEMFSSIDNMASHILSDLPVNSALISAISDSGSLEVETTLASEIAHNCYGQQVFGTNANDELEPRTQHRYICDKPVVAAK